MTDLPYIIYSFVFLESHTLLFACRRTHLIQMLIKRERCRHYTAAPVPVIDSSNSDQRGREGGRLERRESEFGSESLEARLVPKPKIPLGDVGPADEIHATADH